MSLVFQRARSEIGTGFNWQTAPLRAIAVLLNTWTPAATDQFVAAATTAGATLYPPAETIVTPTAAIGSGSNAAVQIWDCADIQAAGVGLGVAFDGLLIYRFVTNNADSWMIGWFDAPGVGGSAVDGPIFSPGDASPFNLF